MTREEKLAAELQKLKAQVEEQNKYIQELQAGHLQVATVLAKDKKRILLQNQGKLTEGDAPESLKDVKVGDEVLVHPMTGAIVQKASLSAGAAIASVKEVLGGGQYLISTPTGEEALVQARSGLEVKAGDRVALTSSLITGVVPRSGTSPFLQRIDTRIRWDDVRGQARAVEVLREAVEWPKKHKELFSKFNRKPSKGILLWGPPGVGKTLLAKATVGALNEDAADPAFFYVKGPEILVKWLGDTEGHIREIFAQAREHQKRTGEQPVLFIDEADAILRKRGTGISTDIGNTVVPQFLSEMDGLAEGGPLVLLATNEAKSLDEAVVRPGRVDTAVELKRPGGDETVDLFNYYLRNVPLAEPNEDYGNYIAARIFTRDDLSSVAAQMSGAVVANLVQEGISTAIRREIANPKCQDKGLLRADLAAAAVGFAQSREGVGA